MFRAANNWPPVFIVPFEYALLTVVMQVKLHEPEKRQLRRTQCVLVSRERSDFRSNGGVFDMTDNALGGSSIVPYAVRRCWCILTGP